MDKRLKLQSNLEKLLGSKHVYYQPPASLKMEYPCIRYSKSTIDSKNADNSKYATVEVSIIKNILLWGDANADKTVDSIDAMLALRLSVGLISEEDVDTLVLDVNGDGSIDSIDAMLILRHSVNLIEIFPVEE